MKYSRKFLEIIEFILNFPEINCKQVLLSNIFLSIVKFLHIHQVTVNKTKNKAIV